jgi:hypothetical protein
VGKGGEVCRDQGGLTPVGWTVRSNCCRSIADKLTFVAEALADLKIGRAAVERAARRRADLGPVQYLASLLGHPPSINRCYGALSSVATGQEIPRAALTAQW